MDGSKVGIVVLVKILRKCSMAKHKLVCAFFYSEMCEY